MSRFRTAPESLIKANEIKEPRPGRCCHLLDRAGGRDPRNDILGVGHNQHGMQASDWDVWRLIILA